MDNDYRFTTTEEERAARRAQRMAARRQRERERRRKMLLRLLPVLGVVVLAGAAIAWGLHRGESGEGAARAAAPTIQSAAADPEPDQEPEPAADPEPEPPRAVLSAADAVQLGEEIVSNNAVLIDLDEGVVLAEKNAGEVISPASMTKILTILVAAEQITDLDAGFTMTREITDYCYRNDCSAAGFLPGEIIPIRDLFYATILPSGADGALALAICAAGSQEAFVELMNEKAAELGVSQTARFANSVGVYDENNVCTVYDVALILRAALDNPLCREVLGQRIYAIAPSEAHPEGLELSNWFIRKIEDHMPEHIQVTGAKTGYVTQSGNCAASVAQDSAGKRYLCVTAQAWSGWRCIFDHVALYEGYAR